MESPNDLLMDHVEESIELFFEDTLLKLATDHSEAAYFRAETLAKGKGTDQ